MYAAGGMWRLGVERVVVGVSVVVANEGREVGIVV
jgi:hypothetical protein